MAKRHYSDHDKAIALEIIARFGGEVTRECLATIRQALAAPDLNKSTVYRWAQSQPVAAESQPAKKAAADQATKALDVYFEDVARAMLAEAIKPETIGAMKGRDLVISAATAVDKMRLLRNMPTEIVALWPGFMEALSELELNPADVFNAIIDQARAEKAKRDHSG